MHKKTTQMQTHFKQLVQTKVPPLTGRANQISGVGSDTPGPPSAHNPELKAQYSCFYCTILYMNTVKVWWGLTAADSSLKQISS